MKAWSDNILEGSITFRTLENAIKENIFKEIVN